MLCCKLYLIFLQLYSFLQSPLTFNGSLTLRWVVNIGNNIGNNFNKECYQLSTYASQLSSITYKVWNQRQVEWFETNEEHCLSSDPFSWGRLRWLLCYLVNINLEMINMAIALWVQCICNTTARSSNKFQISPTLLGCWQFQRTLKSKVLILRNYQIFEDKRNSDKPGKYLNMARKIFVKKTYLL